MAHRLDPLLKPRSIAVLGASERPGSVGRRSMENLVRGGFPGRLYPVNPGRESVLGIACHPSLEALPETVEHVIFAVGEARLEAALEQAIAHGARAATIVSALVLEDDAEPYLAERVAARVRAAGLLVCGPNAMGFYNFRDRVWACGFDTREHRETGNVTLISHSGSGMCGIVDCDERIDFNLAVSTGQELSVTLDQYLDFALDLPETRVVGLFLETARNPRGLIRALEKAERRGVPVVALKVGRSELAARLTVSHSGAIAGRDGAFDALFDRYGVQRVDDMDELASALILLAQPHRIGAGALVALHDSGGERELLIDLAERAGVPLAEIGDATRERLDELLDPGLVAVNPLDGWSRGGPGSDRNMAECFATLLADPNAALGAVVHDRAPGGRIYSSYLEYLQRGHEATGKPAALVANRQGTGSDPLVVDSTRAGFPVLDGVRSFLVAVRCAFGHRDHRARPRLAPERIDRKRGARWRARLGAGETLDEFEAGALLSEFGVPVNPARIVEDARAALSAARALGYPVALKTATAGIAHKARRDGVRLNLTDEQALLAGYRELAARLGPRALIAPMVEPGLELMLGMVHDEQFGPLVVLGFGGTDLEQIRDVGYALPPFDAATARRLLERLNGRARLDPPARGPAPAIEDFCHAAARFSQFAAALGSTIAEADVNPVIVTPGGCVAVDALIVGRQSISDANHRRQAG